ncbi:hypothetical protein RPD_0021 [Rhodopseudomonas palustris BisB5]|uniref:Uncharacterized protein n=1 Tax=Rhodopseudomonas palustris (strain BisB5) TaxID=316057 RepID=Q13F78_RHOPS|nr:hypothetical protein RPD_0021 [Rhodopseudomonas palustris BisB5]
MLVVKIEPAPSGFVPMRRCICGLAVANVSDLADIADYRVIGGESPNGLKNRPAGIAETMFLNHPGRHRVWALVERPCGVIMKAGWVGLSNPHFDPNFVIEI